MAIAKQEQFNDLSDKLGLVPHTTTSPPQRYGRTSSNWCRTLPADQQERYMKDLDQMTPARFEKGIQFIQNQLSKK
jgi:hypothetical protein